MLRQDIAALPASRRSLLTKMATSVNGGTGSDGQTSPFHRGMAERRFNNGGGSRAGYNRLVIAGTRFRFRWRWPVFGFYLLGLSGIDGADGT